MNVCDNMHGIVTAMNSHNYFCNCIMHLIVSHFLQSNDDKHYVTREFFYYNQTFEFLNNISFIEL